MSISLIAIDRNGERHELTWDDDQSLMESLRDNDLPVLASCGGTASCSTCHVYVEQRIMPTLPEKSADEVELLEDNDWYEPDRSRLSCQIAYQERLDGMTVALAPEE